MDDLGLQELFEYFKEKLGLIVCIVLFICLLGCVYGLFIQKPMYNSYTTVILGGDENDSNNGKSITQNDVMLNQNLVDTYAEVVKSKRVLNQVIDKLKLDLTYEQLNNKINVTALNETEIIKITVTDRDAKKAKNIANVTADYFTREIVKLYSLNNVNILDEATEAVRPYNISIVKQLIVYFMIGCVISFGILFILYYFDRTIKSVEQIEEKIKLPVLGSVEYNSRGGRK